MTHAARVRIAGLHPARPWFSPGSVARVEADLVTSEPATVRVVLQLLDLDRVVATTTGRWRLPAGVSHRTLGIRLPGGSRHGYGLRLDVRWPGGGAVSRSAVEALAGWWESPRHAALTDFGTGLDAGRRVAALRAWHVTVVQHYDWMYRHYRYEPPGGAVFLDPLGRRVSHRSVRALVRAGHGAGIASLAYGSVYGAEREYVALHPDERVFDEAGAPLSLGETFCINDLRPGRPWRARLLGEYERACRRFAFDGIHMDTYGPPHRAFAADGAPIDFAALYPGLIAEAAERVAGARDGARVLFNCVEGFPVETVAASPAAALYLELWPPDVRDADVVRWIDRARALGEGRQVVIAAYLSAFRNGERDPDRRPPAFEAAALLTALIAAAGGYHHVLADDGRLLVEGYYPEARRITARERRELRAAWAFTARYLHLLSDPALEVTASDGLELRDEHGRAVPLSSEPAAGAVWARATRTPAGTVVQLVDLSGQADDRWDAARQPSPIRRGWQLCWPDASAPVAASPWTHGSDARPLSPAGDGEWRLPAFRRWLLVVPRAPASPPARSDRRRDQAAGSAAG